MEKISVLAPTRGRPNSMMELTDSVFTTAKHSEFVDIIFYIDSDDEESQSCANQLAETYGRVKAVIGERIVMSDMWNKCCYASDADIFMQCADDARMRTIGWDGVVRDKFASIEDRIGFVFGYDGIHPKGSFGTLGFLHRKWVEAIGYFLPPFFEADYSDTWINDVGRMLDRFYFIDIFTEHLHVSVGKHPMDKTHEDRIKRYSDNNVVQKYADSLDLRIQDAKKLYEVIASSRS